MKKNSILAIFILVLMTACGENNSTNGNENQIKRENSVNSLLQISDENSKLKSLKGKITSIDDTQPVYFYSQNFDFEEETYKKSYELIYQFKVESNYSLSISFEDSKNQPSKMQLWIDKDNPNAALVFSCGDQQVQTCDNISMEVDYKTGSSKVIFNQSKIYDYDEKYLTLSGSISGELQQNPTVVNIPTSSSYNMIYRVSNNNQDIPMTQPNFRFYSFTNHNINNFITSKSIFENFLYIKTINNIVNEVWYAPPIGLSLPLSVWERKSNTNIGNISFNSINLTVNFNQFKMTSDGYPDIYLEGTVGP
ncbi:hypothetical protein GWP85_12940 [Acinetobacter beijerinckii]|uniref:hypothetical protein n=1 Tax=Acinetobacter beijerinckii TaxID=262668 RepID=UPI0023DE01ED|nr:hypothetical protein [Acinetobacter beijerinckii]MDF2418404.1 hypothetical protein [Acinetobacter beijerinckii]